MANTGDATPAVAIDVEELRRAEELRRTVEELRRAEEIRRAIEELRRAMKADMRNLGRRPEPITPTTIYRVFHSVRKEHEQHYHPQIIGIGPFHHDDKAFKSMQQLKWRYLRDLVHRNRERGATFDKFIDAVTRIKTEARSYYSELPQLDDASFVKMMVLDGGFVLEFLIKAFGGENTTYLDEVNWNLPLIRRDLTLLENQVPFRVLQVLFDSIDSPIVFGFEEDRTPITFNNTDGAPLTLMNLVVSYFTRNKLDKLPAASNPETVHHLLHVYHATIRPTPRGGDRPANRSCGRAICSTLKWMRSLLFAPFLWLLSCLLNCRIPVKHSGEEHQRAPRGIPTATQLQESGVKFEKKKTGKAKILDLDVDFDKEEGVMEIAMLSIQEATISMYRNLVAFEQCCPDTGSHFTSFATLMNNLIDTGADVAILKESGIIESKLGEDSEVAELFNNLCSGAYLNYEQHHLVPVFKDVVAYSNIERHKWRAGLMHNYFGNPWAIISLIAASILLCLTVLQTFYAVYAYYRPPSQSPSPSPS